MSFVRSASPRYFAPATFNTLDAEGGLVAHQFDCEFKRLKNSELQQLQADMAQWGSDVIKRLRDRAAAISEAASKGEPVPGAGEAVDPHSAAEDVVARKLLERVMTGWRAVQNPDGSEMTFSMSAVDETEEEFPGFINACAQAFWKSCQPKEAAHLARKN